MSSWASFIFPLCAWLSMLGTAGLHPRLSSPENYGMAKACLGWSRRGSCSCHDFMWALSYSKRQDHSEMPLSYFPSSLEERPLVPFVEHVNDHLLPWNICESWLQARSAFSYLAVSSPAAPSRGFSKPLSTLPGEVENSITAGKCNQGEQEPRLSGPFHFYPPYMPNPL